MGPLCFFSGSRQDDFVFPFLTRPQEAGHKLSGHTTRSMSALAHVDLQEEALEDKNTQISQARLYGPAKSAMNTAVSLLQVKEELTSMKEASAKQQDSDKMGKGKASSFCFPLSARINCRMPKVWAFLPS